MSEITDNLVCVGAIAGAFGVSGEARIKSFCAEGEAIASYGPLSSEDGARQFSLRITRAESGETDVNLLVLTPGLMRMPSGKDLDVRLVHQPIEITHGELRALDEDLNDLLRYGANLRLRTWSVSGKLSEFRRDILTR